VPAGFPRHFPVRDDGRRTLRYHVVAGTARIGARLVLGRGLQVLGLENLPERGPLIIAGNHLSSLDTMLLGGNTPGANYAMAKRELFQKRPIAWMWGGCNVFPVDRHTADRWALRTSIEVLERGGRLILWVEGTRAEAPGMRPAEPGVGFLLRRVPCDVVPVAVWGSERALVKGRLLPRRVPVTLQFGRPFTPDLSGPRHDHQAVADQVGAHIAALLPPEYRGVYADAAAEIAAGSV
ncbi:MAG: lysophospholipid acyltransferase family protein, partial [Candidatus Dormibacteria bacterium]